MILLKRLFVAIFIFIGLQFSTVIACEVTATISTSNNTTICQGKSVQVRVDIANGTGPYNLVISDTSGSEIFSESNFGGTLVYFSFDQENTYFVSEIYDLGADCAGTGIDSIVVSVNPAPTATLSGGGSICDDGVAEACLDIELTTGKAPYTFRLIGSESGNLSYNSANNDYQVCTMSDQDFIWLDLTDNNGCSAKSEDLTGNASVEFFDNPTGVIEGDYMICNDGSTETTLSFVLTGTAPWNINYKRIDDVFVEQNISSSPFSLLTSTDGTYTISALEDANGCTAKAADLTGLATVDYFDEPVVDIFSLIYDCPNHQAEPYEYNSTFNVSGGAGTGNYIIDIFEAGTNTSIDAGTITEIDGIVKINGINDSIIMDVIVTDANNCNPILIEDLQIQCSCPTTATLSATTPTEICDDGSSFATLEISTQGGTGPYDFSIHNDVGDVITVQQITTFPYSLNVSEEDNYFIEAFYDNGELCEAKKSGSVEITVLDLPEATIYSDVEPEICTTDDIPEICIDFVGEGLFTFTLSDGSQTSMNSTPLSTWCIDGKTLEGNYSYEVLSLLDANCTGFSSNESVTYTVEDCIVGLTAYQTINPLTIFPNPVQANQVLHVDHNENGVISILSTDGQLISQTDFSASSNQIATPANSGLYLIKFINQNGKIFTSPLVIE